VKFKKGDKLIGTIGGVYMKLTILETYGDGYKIKWTHPSTSEHIGVHTYLSHHIESYFRLQTKLEAALK